MARSAAWAAMRYAIKPCFTSYLLGKPRCSCRKTKRGRGGLVQVRHADNSVLRSNMLDLEIRHSCKKKRKAFQPRTYSMSCWNRPQLGRVDCISYQVISGNFRANNPRIEPIAQQCGSSPAQQPRVPSHLQTVSAHFCSHDNNNRRFRADELCRATCSCGAQRRLNACKGSASEYISVFNTLGVT